MESCFPLKLILKTTCKPVSQDIDGNDTFDEEYTDGMGQETPRSAITSTSHAETDTKNETNLLDIGDTFRQNELISTSNGNVEQLINETPNQLIETPENLLIEDSTNQLIADPSNATPNGTWDENWLLGPNHEQSIPKNIEPGGDIDLLLLDN